MDKSGAFTSVSGDIFNLSMVVDLLKETAFDYEVTNSYTFDGAISFLPEELGYPQDIAIQILSDMGYPK